MLIQELIGDYYRPSYRTKRLYAELDADEVLEGQVNPRKGPSAVGNAVGKLSKVAVSFGAPVEHNSKYSLGCFYFCFFFFLL